MREEFPKQKPKEKASIEERRSFTLADLEKAKREYDFWLDRMGKDSSNNPNKYHSEIREAGIKVRHIETSGFMPLLIFLASFINRQGYWKLTLFDILCGVSSLLALIVWGLVDSPRLAILLAATGDGFATLPTVRKAWSYPETETGLAYIMSFFAVLIVIPSIPVWNIENASFQVYLLIANTLLIFSVYRKRLKIVS